LALLATLLWPLLLLGVNLRIHQRRRLEAARVRGPPTLCR
jgi:hypothetical protein